MEPSLLRFEIFKHASYLAETRYNAVLANVKHENGERMLSGKPYIEPPEFPATDEIIKIAEKIHDFVSP
jgi:hypothetical protein